MSDRKGIGGAPTKYRPEHIGLTYQYIEQYRELGDAIPSVVGLSEFFYDQGLGVSERTISIWRDEDRDPEFTTAVRRLEAAQQRALMNRGLDRTFDKSVAMMMLARHGWQATTKHEHSGPGGAAIPFVMADGSDDV